MNITEEVHFSKEGRVERWPLVRKLFLSMVIILVASLAFGLGRLTAPSAGEGIEVEYEMDTATVLSAVKTVTGGGVVASKNGEKYHFSHCPGAKQIKEENKVTFETPEAAQASGYTLASNCRQ